MARRSSLLVPVLAGLLAWVGVAAAAPGSTRLGGDVARDGRAIVERISWETADGHGRLVIGVRGTVDYTARAMGADPGSNLPHRAYVDLRPAVLGKDLSRTPLAVDDALAERVRIGQFDPQTVRVVVDLKAPGMFEVRTSERPPRLLLGVVPRADRVAAAPARGGAAQADATAAAPADARAELAKGEASAASRASTAAPRESERARNTSSAAAAPPPSAPATSPIAVARASEVSTAPAAPASAVSRVPDAVAANASPAGVPDPAPTPTSTTAPQPSVAAPAPSAASDAVVVAAAPSAEQARASGSEQARASGSGQARAGSPPREPADGVAKPDPSAAPAPRRTPARQAAKPLRTPTPHVWTVVLDPGHGGRDPGARGVTGDVEKDITLNIAQLVAERLADDPQVRVVLTRTDDSYVSLEQRTAIANAQGADLFISIHANASENPQLAGIETYTLNNTDDRATIRLAALENGLALTGASPSERDLAYILSDLVQTGKEDESVTLARAVQGNLVSYLRDRWRGVVNLGVKKGPFYVLVGAYMPCILVEVAFLTNETEGQRIAARRYQQDVADGIAHGVRRFIATEIPNSNL